MHFASPNMHYIAKFLIDIVCNDGLGSSVTFWEAVGLPVRNKREAKFERKSNVNVPTMSMPPVSSNDPRYNAYMDAIKQLNISVNFSADPCNDFYGYACGSYPTTMSSTFGVVDVKNLEIQGAQIINPKYQQESVNCLNLKTRV